MGEHSKVDGELFQLEHHLSADFGQTVSGLRQAEGGTDSKVYAARFNDQDVFIKMNDDEKLFPMQVELYRLLAEQGIFVPRILDVREQTSLGKPILIEAAMPGLPMSKLDASKRGELMNEAGALLKRIHQITLPGYGWVETSEGGLRGEHESWGAFLVDGESEIAQYLSEHGLISEDEKKALHELWAELETVPLSQGSLLHGDFQAEHIFTDGERITGVIDWGGARVGDPRYDIAVSGTFIDGSEWEDFKRGYGALADDPLVEAYGTMIAARKLKLRHHAQRAEVSIAHVLNRLKVGLRQRH